MSGTVTLDASYAVEALSGALDRFTYNLGVELATARAELPTLRDRVAMAALQGVLAHGWEGKEEHAAVARTAYELADAMLIARAAPGAP